MKKSQRMKHASLVNITQGSSCPYLLAGSPYCCVMQGGFLMLLGFCKCCAQLSQLQVIRFKGVNLYVVLPGLIGMQVLLDAMSTT